MTFNAHGLSVKPILAKTVDRIAAGTGISPDAFWAAAARIFGKFAARNAALLRKRDALQAQIDAYHLSRQGLPWDASHYASFLTSIGYLTPFSGDYTVRTSRVDAEIASTPGPQLVVPVDNARYALNAANARWGSLLDAFYGTDAGPPTTDGMHKTGPYNPKRGDAVFKQTHAFLDTHFALAGGAKYDDVVAFVVVGGARSRLELHLKNKTTAFLNVDDQFAGHVGSASSPTSVFLKHNNLHVEIKIDGSSVIGSTHPAKVCDVLVEAAITAICDCEDSVAAVDAEDKSKVYSNWAGLMSATLQDKFQKGGKQMTRQLNPDKVFVGRDGTSVSLKGRACLLVRNVGIHMYTDAVMIGNSAVPEGLLDLLVTTLAALHDLKPEVSKKPLNKLNSLHGSMYIVKPKMHGPEEVAFVCETFAEVERLFNLPCESIKIGIMDEERRTTVNLQACMHAAASRCIFINTGFLDRTGDEIHTSFEAGAMLPKKDIKAAVWRDAYENWNVDVGLAAGLAPGRGQIGKGMWAAPDAMAAMLAEKSNHPLAGATTAWVPSPTAATLHAIHYHQVDVLAVQNRLKANGFRSSLSDILTPPLLNRKLTASEITAELENNAQGILGYVVRWIDAGVGCSKVPDIHDVGLMEDRATLRISSQHIANWIRHDVVTKEAVVEIFKKMAQVVDGQNSTSSGYVPMAPSFTGNGFACALEMVFKGAETPNGLTEWTLTEFRRREKARASGVSKM